MGTGPGRPLPENTTLLDGDILFLEVCEGSKKHEESPLWQTPNVVCNHRVVLVENHSQPWGRRRPMTPPEDQRVNHKRVARVIHTEQP